MPAKPGKHLDSPFFGLANKSQDYASRLDDASRRAFNNLIALEIEEECRLIVIAGMQMVLKFLNAVACRRACDGVSHNFLPGA